LTGINCPALDHARTLRLSWRDRFGLPVSGLMRVGLRVTRRPRGRSGNAIVEEPLRERCICVVIDNDSDNLYITVTAKAMSPKMRIITRAGQQRYAQAIMAGGLHDL
jgi:hypothetical protein